MTFVDAQVQSLRDEVLILRRTQRRTQQWVVASVAVILAGTLLVGAQKPEPREVVTNRLTLVDRDGRPRATLKCRDDGTVAFKLNDSEQKTRLSFSVASDGTSALSFLDRDSNPRIAMGSNEGEAWQLTYLNRQGRPIVSLGAEDDEERVGLVINRDNQMQGCFFFDTKGTNGLIVRDASGDNVVHAGRDSDGKPMIAITDMEGKHGIIQGLDDRNQPYLELRDPSTARLIRRLP